MITAIHIIGQILLGGFFIYNGVKHFTSLKDYTAFSASMKVPAPKTAVIVTGILLLLGGLGILLNLYVQASIILLAIFLIPTSIMMHDFWKRENPGEKSAQKIQFLKNVALLGALLWMF
jgi:putative oxidoreductase